MALPDRSCAACRENTYFVPVYLAFITLFNAAGWGFGLYRSLVLAAIFLLALIIVLASEHPSLVAARGIRTALPFCALIASLLPVLDAVLSIL